MKESEECPKCFGDKNKTGKLESCKSCEYCESCRFCSEDDGSGCDKRLGHVSYERYNYAREVSSESQIQQQSPDKESDIRRVLEFVLDMDNYTAELVHEVLHGRCSTSSELGKRFGVSRQAIHRKLVDACTEYPELRKLFITRLCGCRRILADSERIARNRKKESDRNKKQMEFNF